LRSGDTTAWIGRLQIGDRWAVWRGEVGDGVPHRHFAAQAVISDTPVRVFDAQEQPSDAKTVLIDPLTLHRIEPGSTVQLIYLEPGRQIDPAVQQILRPIRSAGEQSLISSDQSLPFWSDWLAGKGDRPEEPDQRITAGIRYLDGAIASGWLSLEEVASTTMLSPDRFRHLFAEQMGVPFRRYVLWRRLRRAAGELVSGSDATTAAHAAGFADAAHFARTLKSTFGVTASQALTSR
jgi:AraC-like DNA-binding protein